MHRKRRGRDPSSGQNPKNLSRAATLENADRLDGGFAPVEARRQSPFLGWRSCSTVFNTTMNQASVESGAKISPAIFGWTASWPGNAVPGRPAFALQPSTTYAVTPGSIVSPSRARRTAELPFTWPSFSPDGTRLACTESILNGTTLPSHAVRSLLTLANGTVQTLVDFPAGQYPGVPTWSPDGSQLAFMVRFGSLLPGLNDSDDIDLISADGTDLTPITTGGSSSQRAGRR